MWYASGFSWAIKITNPGVLRSYLMKTSHLVRPHENTYNKRCSAKTILQQQRDHEQLLFLLLPKDKSKRLLNACLFC